MLRLRDIRIVCSKAELAVLPEGKVLINTINAHSYNTAQKDEVFARSLTPKALSPNTSPVGEGSIGDDGDGCVRYLIPDGASIVKACRWLKAKSQPAERIAGWDLFVYEMGRLEERGKDLEERGRGLEERERRKEEGEQHSGTSSDIQHPKSNTQHQTNQHPSPNTQHPRAMFMGSSEKVLGLIRERAKVEYPHIDVVTYSPPYKPEFSGEDNAAIVKAINDAAPDLLWIGMTAPKQEKWAFSHWHELDINCHCGTVGAVFDFFAGTARRAPQWWQRHSLEWLYRLLIEPRRMWRRYVIGNALFMYNILMEYREKGNA